MKHDQVATDVANNELDFGVLHPGCVRQEGVNTHHHDYFVEVSGANVPGDCREDARPDDHHLPDDLLYKDEELPEEDAIGEGDSDCDQESSKQEVAWLKEDVPPSSQAQLFVEETVHGLPLWLHQLELAITLAVINASPEDEECDQNRVYSEEHEADD